MSQDWCELLSYKLDLRELLLSLKAMRGEFPLNSNENFVGWSIQSRTGDYRDGFQTDIEHCYRKDGTFNYKLAKYLDYSHPFEHINRTNACMNSYARLVSFLSHEGFFICRARVTVLRAGTQSIWYSDASPSTYLARIHIPLITNEKCYHTVEGKGSIHMPADGSVYMLWANNRHQIRNDSTEDRYHMIMDAYDTRNKTRLFNSYTRNQIIQNLEEAKIYRNVLDATNLTMIDRMKYSLMRYGKKEKLRQV
jgi:hypothetical protein